MKLVVYTPSHNPEKLRGAMETMPRALAQLPEGIEFEWLVLLNGKGKLLPSFLQPSTTHLATAPDKLLGNIGALKKHACELAISRGATHLVELDHDDELTPNCLRRLVEEFNAQDAPGFLCSDTACTTRYGETYGWKSHSEVFGGRRLWVNEGARTISSRSLFEITKAPNHVRAWTVEAYKKAGGYDATMPLCDDHDLLCRTYIAGVNMRHIPEALYIQHNGPDQTQVQRNAEIQKRQAQVGAKYLYLLALSEAERRGLHAIDLGGAHSPAEGFKSLDIHPGADIVCDVTQGLPFEDNSVGVLRAHDFLEHIPIGKVVPFMNECYRVLAPGGWLLTSTPNTDGRGAFQDPTHQSFWNSNSFWYYTQADTAKYVPEITCRFQCARLVNHYPTDWHKTHLIGYVDAALWCLKDQPTLGRVLI